MLPVLRFRIERTNCCLTKVCIHLPALSPDIQFLRPASVDLPGVSIDLPGVSIDLPGVSIDLPGVSIDLPGVSIDLPGVSIDQTRPDQTTVDCSSDGNVGNELQIVHRAHPSNFALYSAGANQKLCIRNWVDPPGSNPTIRYSSNARTSFEPEDC